MNHASKLMIDKSVALFVNKIKFEGVISDD